MVRIWLMLLLMSFLVVPVGMLATSRLALIPAATVLTAYLAIFLNVWGTVIIVLSAGSVSLDADIVADGILSRACTRTQYILAKLAARVLVVEGVYLIGSVAAGYASARYGANDMTWSTMLTGIAIVGTALLMLVSLGVTMNVLFNHTLVSVIGLLLLWYVAGYLFAFAGAEYMSPTGLTQSLPQILRDSNAPQVVSCSATRTSLSVLFSKEVNPESAEQIKSYMVECPPGTRHLPQTAVYSPATSTVLLSGFHFTAGKPVAVSVEGITDVAGNAVSPAANSSTSNPVPTTGKGKMKARQAQESSRPASRSAWGIPPRVVRLHRTPSSVSVVFSRDMDPVKAEALKNYTVESPPGAIQRPKTAAYNASTKTVLLGGLSFHAGDTVKVTVKNIPDLEGRKIDSGRNSAMLREVQNWKYFAGFGVPALFFAALGVVWFSRRDL